MVNAIKFILVVSVLVYVGVVSGNDEVAFSSKENQTTMVELFTSQGCSSCPPAERWLNTLKDKPTLWSQLVPIAFHVDYWDKLGWPDIYADQAYSARQYRHRQQNHIRSVYTPGLVVNGKEWRGWSQGNTFPAGQQNAGILSFKANQENIQVSYTRARQDIVLNVALLGFGINSEIERGENRGRTLPQEFVALSHRQYAASNGNWTVSLPKEKLKHASQYALALWVSRHPDISPVQATGYWIPREWVEDPS